MDTFHIQGGYPLRGSIRISGAKNAVLPIFAAALLNDGPVNLACIPHLRDVTTMLELLASLGAKTQLADKMSIQIDTTQVDKYCAPMNWLKQCVHQSWCWGPYLVAMEKHKYHCQGGVPLVHDQWIFT